MKLKNYKIFVIKKSLTQALNCLSDILSVFITFLILGFKSLWYLVISLFNFCGISAGSKRTIALASIFLKRYH